MTSKEILNKIHDTIEDGERYGALSGKLKQCLKEITEEVRSNDFDIVMDIMAELKLSLNKGNHSILMTAVNKSVKNLELVTKGEANVSDKI